MIFGVILYFYYIFVKLNYFTSFESFGLLSKFLKFNPLANTEVSFNSLVVVIFSLLFICS